MGGPLARVPLAGKGRPPPPPTRAEYVTYRRNEAIEDFAAASEDEAHPEWSEDAEAEAVAQAGEDAALEWDDHHAQCLATVGRIVGAEDDDAEEDWDEEGWDEVGELQSSSPLVGEEGGAPAPEGEGSAAPAAASTAGETAAAAADPSPDLSRKGRGEAPQPSPAPDPDPDEVPTDLPYEIKSMPPVTHPNPQTRAFPRPATVSHVSTPPQRTAGSRHSTAPCARPVAGGETLPASLVHSPRAASAVPPFTLPSTPAPLSSSEGERP